jgi:RimJ/RimL family protein N-acetyltransferase
MPCLIQPVVPAGSMAAMRQPALDRDDLRLRTWRAEDASAVAEAYADPAIQRWHARVMTPDEATEWIAQWPRRWAEESGAGWAVVRGGQIAGQISLRRIDLADGIAEISYWTLPADRGHGVAARSLAMVSEWSFADLGLHRLEVFHSTQNEPSCRVATKAGFPAEGTKRSEALHPDGWHDMHMHARVAGD